MNFGSIYTSAHSNSSRLIKESIFSLLLSARSRDQTKYTLAGGCKNIEEIICLEMFKENTTTLSS